MDFTGLTPKDRALLLDAKKNGADWLSRDKGGWIARSTNIPQWGPWGYDHAGEYKWIGKDDVLKFVLPEHKAHIPTVLALIAAIDAVQESLFINGYPVADMEVAAKLMNSAGLMPADLRKCIDNIEYVTTLVYNDVRRAMDNVGAEYAARMLNGYYLKEKE